MIIIIEEAFVSRGFFMLRVICSSLDAPALPDASDRKMPDSTKMPKTRQRPILETPAKITPVGSRF
jgi:hypothetical protein